MVRFWCGLLTGPQDAPHFGGEFAFPLERGEAEGWRRSIEHGFGQWDRIFSPSPRPSPLGRENRPPLRGESNSLSRAGVSALNRGAHGACVAEFIGSWQAHWCFERGFPLTP